MHVFLYSASLKSTVLRFRAHALCSLQYIYSWLTAVHCHRSSCAAIRVAAATIIVYSGLRKTNFHIVLQATCAHITVVS
jgi:hypothetical protein